MVTGLLLPPEVADRIKHILTQLHQKTQASCVLLVDTKGMRRIDEGVTVLEGLEELEEK